MKLLFITITILPSLIFAHGDEKASLLVKRKIETTLERSKKIQKLNEPEENQENIRRASENLTKRTHTDIDEDPPSKKTKTQKDILEEIYFGEDTDEIGVLCQKVNSMDLLGFDLDDVNVEPPSVLSDENEVFLIQSSALRKRSREEKANKKKKAYFHAPEEPSPSTEFFWQFYGLFEQCKNARAHRLNQSVVNTIKTNFLMQYEKIDWTNEIKNIPAIWWLTFVAYAFDKSLIENIDLVLSMHMDGHNLLQIAPPTKPHLTVKFLLHYARSSFLPVRQNSQEILWDLWTHAPKHTQNFLEPENLPDVILRDYINQGD